LAPLNVCASAVDSVDAVNRLRDVIDAVTVAIRTKADEIENARTAEENETAWSETDAQL
jgi:hypothetical protein